MQYRVKGAYSHFTIDTDKGMVYQIHTKFAKKEVIEYETNFKRFTHIKEAYEYLSQTERMPVWKLKSRSEKVEA
jgi:hypothetical protein